MRLDFRQGIVKADLGNFLQTTILGISISTSNSIVQLALAHRDTNYLHTEHTDVVNAWTPPPTTGSFYLYVDINTNTGKRSFGYNDTPLTYGPTAPIAPVENQHWFDTTTNEMKEYFTAISSWKVVIRVFVASIDSGSLNEFPIGTQVGITHPKPIFGTGAIIFDDSGKAIHRSNKLFFTTEDTIFVNGLSAHAVRLESNIFQVKAQENMAAFSVVFLPEFGEARLARYEDTGAQTLGIVTEDSLIHEMTGMIFQGVVKNVNWNWPQVGIPLWVEEDGELTAIDPHIITSTRSPQVPIARVISEDTIIFEQGLGGKGEKGEPGEGRFDIPHFIPGNMTTVNKVVSSYLIGRQISLLSTLPESVAYCIEAPSANTSYDIQVDGISRGSVNFFESQNVGTLTLTNDILLLPGQRLEIITPPIINIAIQDVSINIIGCAAAAACPII